MNSDELRRQYEVAIRKQKLLEFEEQEKGADDEPALSKDPTTTWFWSKHRSAYHKVDADNTPPAGHSEPTRWRNGKYYSEEVQDRRTRERQELLQELKDKKLREKEALRRFNRELLLDIRKSFLKVLYCIALILVGLWLILSGAPNRMAKDVLDMPKNLREINEKMGDE